MAEGVSWTGGILLVRIPPARETSSDNVPWGSSLSTLQLESIVSFVASERSESIVPRNRLIAQLDSLKAGWPLLLPLLPISRTLVVHVRLRAAVEAARI